MLIPDILFLVYVGYIIIKYGVPTSLSNSYFMMKPSYRNLFTVFTVIESFAVMLSIFPKIHDFSTIILTILAIIGLVFVGIFANFKDKIQKFFHFTGAILSAIATIIWTLIIWKYSWIILLILGVVGISTSLIFNKKNIVFWLEMVCFVHYFIITTLILNLCYSI